MTQTTHDAGELFSGKPSGTKILGYSEPSVYTPKIDPMYAFHESSRDVIVWFLMERSDPLYLFGPCGCGKSSQIRQIAARLNYPVFEATGHDRLEFPDLVGHLSVQNGNMEFGSTSSPPFSAIQRGDPSRMVFRPARVEGEQRSASLKRKIPPCFIAIVRGPS